MLPSNRTVFFALAVSPLLVLTLIIPAIWVLVLLFDLLLIFLVFAECIFVLKAGSVTIRRKYSKRLSNGVKNKVEYEVANLTGQSLEIELRDDFPESFELDTDKLKLKLLPHSTAKVFTNATPKRRGKYDLGDIYIRFGFFFAKRNYRISAVQTVNVFPDLLQMQKYDVLASARHLHDYGIHLAKNISVGKEFDQLRRYLPGDDYRVINWKATARVHSPITQTYQLEKNQSILICIDAGRHMTSATGDGSGTKFDAAVNTALMLAYVANRSGDKPGLVLFSNELHTYLAPKSGKGQLSLIIDHLYRAHPSLVAASYRELYGYVRSAKLNRSLVLIITDVGEGDESTDMLKYIPRFAPKHLPVCITIAETKLRELAYSRPGNVESLFDKAAALEIVARRESLLTQMATKGVHMLDLTPDQLTTGTVNKYIELKSRQVI